MSGPPGAESDIVGARLGRPASHPRPPRPLLWVTPSPKIGVCRHCRSLRSPCASPSLLGWALLARQVVRFSKVFRVGQPDPSRTNDPGTRTWTVVREFLGTPGMARLRWWRSPTGSRPWASSLLFATLVNAFFQLIWADFRLPLIGHPAPFEWLIELFAVMGFIGIVVLIIVRQLNHPAAGGCPGGAAGSTGRPGGRPTTSSSPSRRRHDLHHLVAHPGGRAHPADRARDEYRAALPADRVGQGHLGGLSEQWLRESIYVVAAVKILTSFAWMITVSLQPTMGVAWHRFLAFVNIWFAQRRRPHRARRACR